MRLCAPHCGLAPESGSGGEVYERELLRGLAADHRVHCDILLARGKPHPEVPGWTIHPVWPPKGLRWYVTPFIWPQAIKRCWDRRPFDLLRAHSVRFAGPSALWARQRYRLPVPVVAHHHHLDPSPLNRLIERRVIEGSDLVITDSEFSRRELGANLGVRTDHVRVVYCGVRSMPTSAPIDTDRYHVGGREVILTIGPLIARKNPWFLLDAIEAVVRERPRALLVWLGDGPLLEPLVRETRRRGLGDDARFLGYVSDAAKADWLRLASVFAFPSKLEGFALAPQEAMAHGRPVVAFRVASMPEMIEDGVSGFLVPEDDRRAFSDRVVRLLGDAALRLTIGEGAKRRIRTRFGWERTVRGVLSAYEEAIRAHR